jgi:hypothetical protein
MTGNPWEFTDFGGLATVADIAAEEGMDVKVWILLSLFLENILHGVLTSSI